MSIVPAELRTVEPTQKPLALIIDDQEKPRKVTRGMVEAGGFHVLEATDYVSAIKSLQSNADRLDLLVVDLYLPEKNLGWKIIAEAKPLLPFWCCIAVLTAYPETQPAAGPAGVAFFEKGKEGFTEFVSKHCQICKQRLNGTSYADVNTEGLEKSLEYKDLMMCRAITDAKRVDVLRRLTGSFQEGAVLQVRLTPRDNAPDCDAVVKCGPLDKANREVAGQAKLMWYWERIGMSLPPLRQYRSLLTSKELVLVTPFARGRTLSEVVTERWYGDHVERVKTFCRIFQALGDFLESIKSLRECNHGLDYTFANAYLTPESESRKAKTVPVLEKLIGTWQMLLTCVDSSITVPNPLILFSEHEGVGNWHWQEIDVACGAVTYGHGDFHVGNVMVELAEDGTFKQDSLTILDYDCVGEYCRHYDRAQLESSFLLHLALAFDERHGPNAWESWFLPALKVLTSAESEASIADKEFASDLVYVVGILRGNLGAADLKLYYGALFTTLLRVSVSQSLLAKRRGTDLSRSAQRTIVVTLGLLLNQLIVHEHATNETAGFPIPF